MGIKNNFTQAFKDIMKKEGFVGKELSEEAKKDSSLDGYLGQNSAPAANEQPVYNEESAEKESSFAYKSETAEDSNDIQPSAEPHDENTADSYESEKNAEYLSPNPDSSFTAVNSNNFDLTVSPSAETEPPHKEEKQVNEETTVISKNMVITGGIISGFANLRIDGGFKGDIKITKDVCITGTVVGNIECNNASLCGSSVQGLVTTNGTLKMDRDSVLLGDAAVSNLEANGRIKGNVTVSGKALLKSDAVILGDIAASTITIQDGAVIQGFVKTTFLQDDSSANVFPDAITVEEE